MKMVKHHASRAAEKANTKAIRLCDAASNMSCTSRSQPKVYTQKKVRTRQIKIARDFSVQENTKGIKVS
jgi:hypothetical protein